MHCIGSIALDGMYVAALSSELAVHAAPIVLIKEKLILDASKLARERGVNIGQSLAEARAILGKEGSFIEWSEGRFSKASEAWLDVVSEFTGVIEPQSEHHALLDLSGHPDPFKVAEEVRTAVEHKCKVAVSIGIGPNRWIAETACRMNLLAMMPLLTPRRFVGPLSTLCLEPVDWKDRERLMALGYRTIGEVAGLSYTTLKELFGKRAFVIAQAAQGGGNPRVMSLYPRSSRSALWYFEAPPENWVEVEEAGKRLALSLGECLSRDDLTAYDLEVIATREDATRSVVVRSFTAPLKSAKGIERALLLMLKDPLESPVERLLVRLKNLERPRRVQKTLEGMVKGAECSDALDLALKSLQTTFGAGAIERAAALPIARFQAVRRAWAEANGWVWR